MASILHKCVLAVRGFANQRQIGLIVDKCTKALSKNRMIASDQKADRSGGNVHVRFLVVRSEFPLESIPRSAREASRSRDRRRVRKYFGESPTIRGFGLLTSVVKSGRRSCSAFFQYFLMLCPVPGYFCCGSATAYCCSFIVRFSPDSRCHSRVSHS